MPKVLATASGDHPTTTIQLTDSVDRKHHKLSGKKISRLGGNRFSTPWEINSNKVLRGNKS
jgi:hypothetical protein